MPRFAVGQRIETREPTIEVDPGMEPGRHRFQLEVIGESGGRSAPVVVIVEIRRATINPIAAPPESADRMAAPPNTPATPRRTTQPAAPKRKARPRKKEK
jgi:hypothetical protein